MRSYLTEEERKGAKKALIDQLLANYHASKKEALGGTMRSYLVTVTDTRYCVKHYIWYTPNTLEEDNIGAAAQNTLNEVAGILGVSADTLVVEYVSVRQ